MKRYGIFTCFLLLVRGTISLLLSLFEEVRYSCAFGLCLKRYNIINCLKKKNIFTCFILISRNTISSLERGTISLLFFLTLRGTIFWGFISLKRYDIFTFFTFVASLYRYDILTFLIFLHFFSSLKRYDISRFLFFEELLYFYWFGPNLKNTISLLVSSFQERVRFFSFFKSYDFSTNFSACLSSFEQVRYFH